MARESRLTAGSLGVALGDPSLYAKAANAAAGRAIRKARTQLKRRATQRYNISSREMLAAMQVRVKKGEGRLQTKGRRRNLAQVFRGMNDRGAVVKPSKGPAKTILSAFVPRRPSGEYVRVGNGSPLVLVRKRANMPGGFANPKVRAYYTKPDSNYSSGHDAKGRPRKHRLPVAKATTLAPPQMISSVPDRDAFFEEAGENVYIEFATAYAALLERKLRSI